MPLFPHWITGTHSTVITTLRIISVIIFTLDIGAVISQWRVLSFLPSISVLVFQKLSTNTSHPMYCMAGTEKIYKGVWFVHGTTGAVKKKRPDDKSFKQKTKSLFSLMSKDINQLETKT